jgi:DNA-directed RNA polymerase beta subunit
MPLHRYFLPDFVEIQRESFLNFLKEGILEEFSRRNPITNISKTIEIFFYADYFCLTKPDYSIQQAIFFKKSYTSKLYVPVQYTDKKKKQIFLKWMLVAQLPLMTKRGHFVLNGAARVIINQLVRSPGVYFRENFYEIYLNKFTSKPNRILKRFYADIICLKGTWVRIEIDKDFCMWVRLKKGPKIPLLWFLLGMGLNEKLIFESVISPTFLLKSFQQVKLKSLKNPRKTKLSINDSVETESFLKKSVSTEEDLNLTNLLTKKNVSNYSLKYPYVSSTPEAWKQIAKLFNLKKLRSRSAGMGLRSGPGTGNSMKTAGVPLLGKSPQLGFKDAEDADNSFLKNFNSSRPKTMNNFMFSDQSHGVDWSLAPVDNSVDTVELPGGPSRADQAEQFQSTSPEFSSSENFEGFGSALQRMTEDESQNLSSSDHPAKNLVKESFIMNVYDSQKNYKSFLKTKTVLQKRVKETVDSATLGRKWFFQRFMNPRTYDLGKKGRGALNKKLGLTISLNQTTLTAQDLLFITNYLMKVEKGVYPVDDIDHLKNKRIRSAGELIQMQFGVGLMRLEKAIRFKLNINSKKTKIYNFKSKNSDKQKINQQNDFSDSAMSVDTKLPGPMVNHWVGYNTGDFYSQSDQNTVNPGTLNIGTENRDSNMTNTFNDLTKDFLSLNALIQPKFVNGALREFFGTHPLSQFMDQINPLSEITHKRRLSSLGPGGVSRDTATLAIRGIHPSHYGRICPIETPEGKNTGLVNSLTVYARVNNEGLLESPFYSLYKGQIQKSLGKFYLSADQEEHFQTSTPDLNITKKNFLPKQKIPVRFGKSFFTNSPDSVSFIGISTLQMISLATALIPFLEHDDANRALMGSNMQRQAVPLIRPQRPFVGTGLEAKAISDSGHALTSSNSGIVLYVSGSNIIIFTNK